MGLLDSISDLLKQYTAGGTASPENAAEHFDRWRKPLRRT
jgi:hypothetical protein